jgi:hypothetical protein
MEGSSFTVSNWMARLVERLLVKASYLGSNPDIPKKSQMCDIRSGQHIVDTVKNIYFKNVFKKFIKTLDLLKPVGL